MDGNGHQNGLPNGKSCTGDTGDALRPVGQGDSKVDGNRFRANLDEEKPRQILVLVVTVSGASYLGFSQEDTDPDSSTRAALLGVSVLFLVHCFLQCRDTLFVRPHPGVWRVVHGIGWLYLLGIAMLLFHSRAEARRLLSIVFPDLRDYTPPNILPGEVKDLECQITPAAVLSQLKEVWFLAHVIGWWGKMCIFRDWGLCWVLAVGFELLELSLGWLVPQFRECWWDSLVIDLGGANVVGMALGLATLRYLESRTFNWNRQPRGVKRSRALRLLARFSPLRWSKWRWQFLSSFKRMAQMVVLIVVTMMCEVNAFLMLNALDVPKGSSFNCVRLLVMFLVGLLATNEFYEYISNRTCERLGQNVWVILAIMQQLEILTWVKFIPQSQLNAPTPREVRLPWIATLSLFSLWGLLFYTMTKDATKHANPPPTSPSLKCSSKGGEGVAVGEGGGKVGPGAGAGSGSVNEGGVGVGAGAGAGAGARGHRREGSDRAERLRSVSEDGPMSKRSMWDVLKWGMVDAAFLMSFLPLLYLVKQWSY
ncbi:unnamed protein product [Discosporangium mesarthrocarpum]